MTHLSPSQEVRSFIANKITLALTVLEFMKDGKKDISAETILLAIKGLKEALEYMDAE